MMTIEEQKLAVCQKLQSFGIVEPCCDKAICNGWIWCKSQKAIDWQYHGLQVCHEAEKLLTREQRNEYAGILREIVCAAPEVECIANVLFTICATYEQRLEALCRVWFQEKWKD